MLYFYGASVTNAAAVNPNPVKSALPTESDIVVTELVGCNICAGAGVNKLKSCVAPELYIVAKLADWSESQIAT